MKDLNEARKEGKIISFIQNFLKPRSFKVKINKIQSDTKIHIENIPQGNVESPVIFIIYLNKIVAKLPNEKRIQISLYMDCLQISYCDPDWKTVERKFQERCDSVEKNY